MVIGTVTKNQGVNTGIQPVVKHTDKKRYFVTESSVYRILKAADRIAAPDYLIIKAADQFKDTTTAINQMWQGNRIEVVEYEKPQFIKTPVVLSITGICDARTDEARVQITKKALGHSG